MKVGHKTRRGRKRNPVPHKSHRTRKGVVKGPLARAMRRQRHERRIKDDARVEAAAW